MPEQELKLHVPAAASAGVLRAIKDATRIRLQALYFDTPTRELARARIAIRLRQEGRNWVQTLKMPGNDAISRIEINHPRPGPVLDLSVYAGTAAEAPLAAIKTALSLCYQTDVQRLSRKVRTRYGTVELAYDTGTLRAGTLELPISELEFELVSGRPQAIFSAARGWQQRHNLVLDMRSKSERGDALAQLAQQLTDLDTHPETTVTTQREQAIAEFWAPRGVERVKLHTAMTPSQAMSAIAAECIEQIARNAASLAEVDTADVYPAGRAEHVHQLRVGMRRLRSAWKLFEGWIAPVPDALLENLRTHFSALGANRDQDVLNESITPVLMRAGMPTIAMAVAPPAQDARAISAGKHFQGWLLDLFAWSLDVPPIAPASVAAPAPSRSRVNDVGAESAEHAIDLTPTIIPLLPIEPPSLNKCLTKRLRRWHKQIVTMGTQFSTLDIPARHALRKRGKRLRYSLAFAESLLPNTPLRSYRKLLSRVQDILGEINDLALAQGHYQINTDTHPQAWFALGWISARIEELSTDAQAAFDALATAKPFWK